MERVLELKFGKESQRAIRLICIRLIFGCGRGTRVWLTCHRNTLVEISGLFKVSQMETVVFFSIGNGSHNTSVWRIVPYIEFQTHHLEAKAYCFQNDNDPPSFVPYFSLVDGNGMSSFCVGFQLEQFY